MKGVKLGGAVFIASMLYLSQLILFVGGDGIDQYSIGLAHILGIVVSANQRLPNN